MEKPNPIYNFDPHPHPHPHPKPSPDPLNMTRFLMATTLPSLCYFNLTPFLAKG
jgi:hypothetical protein